MILHEKGTIAAAVMVQLDGIDKRPQYQRRKTADANTGSRVSEVILQHRPAECCSDADDGCTL